MGRPCICCIKPSSGSSSSSSSSSGSGSSSVSASSSSSSDDSGGGEAECCAVCFSVSLSNAVDDGSGGIEPGPVEATTPVQNQGCAFFFDADEVGCGAPCDPDQISVGRLTATCVEITNINEIPESDTEGREKYTSCVENGKKVERWSINVSVACIECPTGDFGIPYADGTNNNYYFCCGETPSGCLDLHVSQFIDPNRPYHCTMCWTINKVDEDLYESSSSSSVFCPCVSTPCPDGGFSEYPTMAIEPEIYKNINQFREMLGPGPGTELHKIIPKFLESDGCGCRDMAKKMNFWGPEKCDIQRDHIVDYLVKKGKEVKLFGWVPKKMIREVSNRMLTLAIDRAKNKQTENWFVAVTTAPRQVSTINTCLESLVVAGFNPYIFAEPETNGIDLDVYGERLIQNKEKKGVWYNWINSARYAIENSDAEIIMTVQDDSMFHPDSKTFTESMLWPAKDVGFVSLYTPKHYSFRPKNKTELKAPGVNRVYTRSLWGACALVWPRKVLEEVLQHKIIYTWLGVPTRTRSIWKRKKEERRNDPSLVQNSDTAIGKIMNSMKRSMYFVDPSPVNHFATHSTTGHGGNLGRRNCHRCAEFSVPLDRQVPLMNNEQELFKIDYKDIEI